MPNNESDQKNGNWGTRGTNITWDKVQGNRGRQIQETKTKNGGK